MSCNRKLYKQRLEIARMVMREKLTKLPKFVTNGTSPHPSLYKYNLRKIIRLQLLGRHCDFGKFLQQWRYFLPPLLLPRLLCCSLMLLYYLLVYNLLSLFHGSSFQCTLYLCVWERLTHNYLTLWDFNRTFGFEDKDIFRDSNSTMKSFME